MIISSIITILGIISVCISAFTFRYCSVIRENNSDDSKFDKLFFLFLISNAFGAVLFGIGATISLRLLGIKLLSIIIILSLITCLITVKFLVSKNPKLIGGFFSIFLIVLTASMLVTSPIFSTFYH